MSDYPPSDWPEMPVRVEEALRRIREGLGLMRIPAHWGDADLVVGDLLRENAALRKRVEEMEQELNRGHNVGCNEALAEAQARAEKAERERDEARAEAQNDYKALWEQDTARLQADLDAALLLCIEADWDVKVLGLGYEPKVYEAHSRFLALLEKRREGRG